MLRYPIYSLFAALVFGTVAFAEWRGLSLSRVNEVRNVPRSIRDNPGAYRSHYGYYGGRYFGGK